jgi:formylglycine-generating enzyme required for sulfatase activity
MPRLDHARVVRIGCNGTWATIYTLLQMARRETDYEATFDDTSLGGAGRVLDGSCPALPAPAPNEDEPRAPEPSLAVGLAASDPKRAVEIAGALASEFVEIPCGIFHIGCSPGDGECLDNERPMYTVSIEPFRMGKYEVTVGQFRQFVKAAGYRTDSERGEGCATVQADGQWAYQTGRDWRNPGFPQTDRHPVVCVSWNDAEAYVQWLSRQGGGRYRLPSESEWEYAARAGGRACYGGDSEAMLCDYGNVADRTANRQFSGWDFAASCDDGKLYTAPVGGYRSNRFEQHDMQENVWEWTGDCYHDSYVGAPSDGAAWTAGECARRVSRGGSWGTPPSLVRSYLRDWITTVSRGNNLGFRLVQDR